MNVKKEKKDVKRKFTISIITVSYNSALTIQDTFDSIKEQDYSLIEYIVVDGKSTDGTLDLIHKNQDIISKWVSEKDAGIYDAMNKGITMASGDIIGILNSDDVYYNSFCVSQVMNAFNMNPTSEVVFGKIINVSQDLNRVVRKWKTAPFELGSFKRGWHPPHPAFFVKREAYINHGVYDLKFKIASDFDMMLRLLEVKRCKSTYLDNVITKMRTGGESNRSISNIIRGNREIRQSFKKNKIYISPFYTIFRLVRKLLEIVRLN